MRQKCSVCGNRDKDGGSDMGLLKLKPVMLELLGIKKDVTYYVCSCAYEVEAVILGKRRRRWADDAKLNIGIKDIVKTSDTENVAKDHAYIKDTEEEDEREDDFSQDALDLKMGSDEFQDSGSMDYREETVEEETIVLSSSQCSLSQSVADSEDSYIPSSQDESRELSQLSQASSTAGALLTHGCQPNTNPSALQARTNSLTICW